jgi:hypothetical protein
MKYIAGLLLAIFVSDVHSQNKAIKIESFAGLNMTKLRKREIGYLSGYRIEDFKVHTQLGGQAGVLLSMNKLALTPLVGLQISRNTCYTSFSKVLGYNNYIQEQSDIYYMRWDLIRTDFLFMLQIALGSEKDIRIQGGILLSSNLSNLSEQRYWLTDRSVWTSAYSHVEKGILISNTNTFLCGGIQLPVPKTNFSIQGLWRFCPAKMNFEYGLSESGMQLSVCYNLNNRKQTDQ